MFLKYKKIILTIVIFGSLLSNFYFFNLPKVQALDGGAGWADFFQTQLKEWVLDPAARLFARRLLKTYLDSIVNEINTGGRTRRGPSFATSWRNFLVDAEHRGEDIFGAILYDAKLCPYFGGQVRTTFRARNVPISEQTRVGNLDTFQRRAKCTMPYGWSPKDLDDNFVKGGGWRALIHLAEPQNNFYGSLLMSAAELAAQRALESTGNYGEISAGRGFTGTRATCRGGQGVGGMCINNKCDSGVHAGETCYQNISCAPINKEARCTFMGRVLTPASVLGDAASTYIDENISWLITSDELFEVLFSMLGGMISKMRNFGSSQKATDYDSRFGPDGDPVDDTKGEAPNGKANQCRSRCNGKKGDDYKVCFEDCMNTRFTSPGEAECSDKKDNNNNKLTDYPDDPGCYGYGDPTETGGNSPPEPPGGLPDSTAAIQICDSVGTTCLTAQWWKAGKAGPIIDPLGDCQTSNCVLLNHQIRDGSNDANIFQDGSVIISLLGAPDYPNGTRAWTCMRDGNTNYGLSTNTPTSINLSLIIPAGGAGSCVSSTPQCSDGVDNDDNDGQADFNGAGGLPPDTDCSSPADNDETFRGGIPIPQCNDGADNDNDTKTDLDDPGCSSITDDSESSGSVTLCADINLGSPCQIFTVSNANLVGSTVGDNNAESLETTVDNQQVSVELCTEPDYGNCMTVIGPRTGPITVINTLGSFPLLGGNNTVSSIRITEL